MNASRDARLRPRVLYFTYWGAIEPLGQSLVLPAVTGLAERGAQITLVSFEKADDLRRAQDFGLVQERLRAASVSWIPLRYHKRPKWPATAFDLAQGVAAASWARAAGPLDIVHARAFVGGPMGFFASLLLGARLIYHNEGFYPDEEVDGGVWRLGSPAHRLAKWLEGQMYARADAVITLSERARDVVRALPALRSKGTPVIVVPSCVDLQRFGPRASASRPAANSALRLVYIGSVGARYRLDWVGRFVAVVARLLPQVSLRVLSPAAPELIRSMLARGGLASEQWSLASVPHAEVAAELPNYHAGLFFLTQGLSEHGCSPTKIGEYWASGLPVVTTANVSDTEQIVERHRVGVVIRRHEDAEYERAARELVALLREPDLAARCRRAAEAYYSLDAANDRQMELYRSLMDGGARR